MSNSNDELAKYILENMPDPNDWKPGYFWNEPGKQFELFWENVDYYGKWIAEGTGFELLKACDDDRVVGVIFYPKEEVKGD